jgi:hypothetical protein
MFRLSLILGLGLGFIIGLLFFTVPLARSQSIIKRMSDRYSKIVRELWVAQDKLADSKKRNQQNFLLAPKHPILCRDCGQPDSLNADGLCSTCQLAKDVIGGSVDG